MRRTIDYVLFLAISCIIIIFAMKMYYDGFEKGKLYGFESGRNTIKPKPKVIIIAPKCYDGPQALRDSLWRL